MHLRARIFSLVRAPSWRETLPRASLVTQARASTPTSAQAPALVVLYDGSCPLCAREIALLRRLPAAARLDWRNVCDETFDPAAVAPHLPHVGKLLSEMHVYDPRSGVVHTRVAAFRALYGELGLGVLTSWTAAPVLSGLVDRAYAAFLRARPFIASLFPPPPR